MCASYEYASAYFMCRITDRIICFVAMFGSQVKRFLVVWNGAMGDCLEHAPDSPALQAAIPRFDFSEKVAAEPLASECSTLGGLAEFSHSFSRGLRSLCGTRGFSGRPAAIGGVHCARSFRQMSRLLLRRRLLPPRASLALLASRAWPHRWTSCLSR